MLLILVAKNTLSCPDVSLHARTVMQLEYATDIAFKKQSDLNLMYDPIIRTAIPSVKSDNIASFLDQRLTLNYEGEVGNNFNTRILGTRIKHQMGEVSIKMYDKFGIVLRIECTCNDISHFRHIREVKHKDGRVLECLTSKAFKIKLSVNLFPKKVLLQFHELLKGFMSTD